MVLQLLACRGCPDLAERRGNYRTSGWSSSILTAYLQLHRILWPTLKQSFHQKQTGVPCWYRCGTVNYKRTVCFFRWSSVQMKWRSPWTSWLCWMKGQKLMTCWEASTISSSSKVAWTCPRLQSLVIPLGVLPLFRHFVKITDLGESYVVIVTTVDPPLFNLTYPKGQHSTTINTQINSQHTNQQSTYKSTQSTHKSTVNT